MELIDESMPMGAESMLPLDMSAQPIAPPVEQKREPDEAERRLVAQIRDRIIEDRRHFKKDFERMRRDMQIARTGADPKIWPTGNYTANLIGRHINQKVAALYAKNPTAVARRKEKLDFQIWDESEQSLMMAAQTVQVGMQVDPVTGMQLGATDPAFQQAMALVQDFQQGMRAREMMAKIGKTLELVFHHYTREQMPVEFKTSMKQAVRRAATCGVAYAKLGFQREFENDPQVTQRISDFQAQLRNIDALVKEINEPDEGDEDREVQKRELEIAMKSLQEQEFVMIREGLTFDFPTATAVIPDRLTRHLVGFVGARHLTIEYFHTREEAERLYGVELDMKTSVYNEKGEGTSGDQIEMVFDENGEAVPQSDLVCVWEHYDRDAGVVYLLCDGHAGFLRPPGPPSVYVETFWPVEALTFNEIEDTASLFPPSDVTLAYDMQHEYNRSRQGKREHRRAARPRFMTKKGALDDESKVKLQTAEPFEVVEVNPLDGSTNLAELIQPLAMPGVDPNLYDTNEIFTDISLVVGAQEAQFGAVAKATATETSIAESSRIASVDSNVDDLDGFLTRVARSAGQILLREMSPEEVKKIAGPGAVWPQMTLDEVANELSLEITAGSSGRPNQAQEIRNWKEMLPFLIQMPGINPIGLVKESLRRLDDKLDLNALIAEGNPAIAAINRMGAGGPAAPAPGAAPEDQGGAGADNASVPGGPAGTDAPMGNNQQPV